MAKKRSKKQSKGSAPVMTPAQQSALFVKTAKELGVDESGDAFSKAFKKIVKPSAKIRRRAAGS